LRIINHALVEQSCHVCRQTKKALSGSGIPPLTVLALVWCVGPLQYLNAIPALATLCQAFILALSTARLGRCALGAYINIDEM
jgi:hypothetical protein